MTSYSEILQLPNLSCELWGKKWGFKQLFCFTIYINIIKKKNRLSSAGQLNIAPFFRTGGDVFGVEMFRCFLVMDVKV